MAKFHDSLKRFQELLTEFQQFLKSFRDSLRVFHGFPKGTAVFISQFQWFLEEVLGQFWDRFLTVLQESFKDNQ